jgi:P-type Cu+ transporter
MSSNESPTSCYHCGSAVREPSVEFDGKLFCCAGCKTVYEILAGNQLCQYYNLERNPGITPALRPSPRFDYLDDPLIRRQIIDFTDGEVTVVHFTVPRMHCSSCIWLLEQLSALDKGILLSRVDFLKKRLMVRYSESTTSLRRIAILLASLGYEPELNLGTVAGNPPKSSDRSLYVKIGVAAFCFGNIMLFSLPEYLATSPTDAGTRSMFGWINLALSLPVFFYSSSPFFDSAFRGIRRAIINIDVPIALGIAIVFIRSAADVVAGYGPGYFDSLTGLVFFLLIGRLFQNKTYEHLNFGRKVQSYLPLAVSVRKEEAETTVPVSSLRPGDRIIIRNNEIIPADGVIMQGAGRIDYGFVTGESRPQELKVGDTIYAGGKQKGGAIEIETVREVSHSSLLQMWNDFGPADKVKSRLLTLSNSFGKYFTAAILIVATGTAIFWWFAGPDRILNAVTSVLIISCPCALALAAPFTFWTAMRVLGKNGLFLRNASVIEAISRIDTIVFDKTGTITRTDAARLTYTGTELDTDSSALIASLARSSTHPLSRSIAEHLGVTGLPEVHDLEEVEGEGVSGIVDGKSVRLGSPRFTGDRPEAEGEEFRTTSVSASIDGVVVGRFTFENAYRDGMELLFTELGADHELAILSGDSEREADRLSALYAKFRWVRFRQKPEDKREAILGLQSEGRGVMMVGDGLNDAGALWQSDTGIAVSEDISTFSPACDAILSADALTNMNLFLRFASTAVSVVYWGLLLSLMYNLVGLFFAVQGALSPILAAILMPLSSVSVVLFSTVATRMLGRNKGLA